MKSLTAQIRQFGNSAATRFLLLGVLLGISTASCDREEAEVRGQPPRGSNQESHPTEQQVFYTDMLEAYERGDLDQARALARKYLGPAYEDILAGQERGWGIGLRVLAGMLSHENRLPSAHRFGGDEQFADWLEKFLLASRDLIRATPPETKDEATGRQRLLKEAAMQWILARRDQVSRQQLEDWYTAFQGELEAPGYATKAFVSLDDLFASATLATKRATMRQVTPTEAERLTTTIRQYLEGLVAGDVKRVVSATGMEVEEARKLLDSYRRDCNDEGISEIRSIIMPTLALDDLRLKPRPRNDGVFALSVTGIRLETVRTDGAVEWRTISKHLTLREDASGRWIIVPPK